MKTFGILKNKDSSNLYAEALIQAGYRETDPKKSDFILYDVEKRKARWQKDFNANRPAFIYPHTPYSFWLWDGKYEPIEVCCNFVATEAYKNSMKNYGYSSRIEAVGFQHCPVHEFSPSNGKRLVAIFPHPLGNGQYQDKSFRDVAVKSFEWIAKNANHFEHAQIIYAGLMADSGIRQVDDFEYIQTQPYQSSRPAQVILGYIAQADFVIAAGTAFWLSVASGKPSAYMGKIGDPGRVKSWKLYADVLPYPYDITQMNMGDVKEICRFENSESARWKERNIGSTFNRDKFINIIQEYV